MGTMSGTVSVTIVWHNLYKKSIAKKHFRATCTSGPTTFVQVDLPAKQNTPVGPKIPGIKQNTPGGPYRFVTFCTDGAGIWNLVHKKRFRKRYRLGRVKDSKLSQLAKVP